MTDIYNEAKTQWNEMPEEQRAAILEAVERGGVPECYIKGYGWQPEYDAPSLWECLPRRIRPGSMSEDTEPDLSNPKELIWRQCSAAFRDAIKALPLEEVQVMLFYGVWGEWDEEDVGTFYPSHVYRQRPPAPIVKQWANDYLDRKGEWYSSREEADVKASTIAQRIAAIRREMQGDKVLGHYREDV